MNQRKNAREVRYAVVGLGHIVQVAVLPAFQHAERSKLVALVSGDQDKLGELGGRHGVEHLVKYDDFDDFLRAGHVDAVYIGLPNDMHREYTERAARAGVHVLCEKPMAVTEDDCVAMIRSCDENRVKLMIAYRLHFERANMRAVQIARSGELGELRYFESAFSQDVEGHTHGGTRMARKKKRPEERLDVPEERGRPGAQELGGTSEDTMRHADSTPPERESRADRSRQREAGTDEGPARYEDLSVETSDLGRRYPEGATQQPRATRERAQTERESTGEKPLTSMGEQQMREHSPDADDEQDRLVKHMPDRTEHEERISRETRERQKEEPLEERRESKV